MLDNLIRNLLEEPIKNFKLGYKISAEIMESFVHPEKDKIGDNIHRQRIETVFKSYFLGDNLPFWESFGLLAGSMYYRFKYPEWYKEMKKHFPP